MQFKFELRDRMTVNDNTFTISDNACNNNNNNEEASSNAWKYHVDYWARWSCGGTRLNYVKNLALEPFSSFGKDPLALTYENKYQKILP